MKKYKFKVMAHIFENVEIEAENEEEARRKFDREHGNLFTQDLNIDGMPTTVLENPDVLEGEKLYDVTLTTRAHGTVPVAAKNAEEAADKVDDMWSRCDLTDSIFIDFGEELDSITAVNRDNDFDVHELNL